jgi:predicted Zn-dependent protease
MKINRILFASIVLTATIFINSCRTVPISGRKQLSLLPESMLVEMSLTSYGEFLDTNTLSSNQTQTALVKRVGERIAVSVEEYLKENGLESRISDFKWEFNLVEDETPNAWCMPGGKVVFYTGILPYTQSEGGLAVVMGHEIAHAVARHGNERMSQSLLVQTGGLALAAALDEKPDETKQLFYAAYGVGTTLGVMLPYSRSHETEADKLGMIFMAMAGYDPNEAVAFWQRMEQAGGASVPEFLSTHPNSSSRIRELKRFIPEAMKYYKQQ